MRTSSRTLLVLLAVVVISTTYGQVSAAGDLQIGEVFADSCMQRWLRLSGTESDQARTDEQKLAFLKLDEGNHETTTGRHLLSFLLSGGARSIGYTLIQTGRHNYRKSTDACRKKAACTSHGTCQLSAKTSRYTCICPKGLTGQFCGKDVNECSTGKAGCHGKAKCLNTHGSFKCECKVGYSGNGKVCRDINECASSPCLNGGKCSNLENRFSCTCPGGYSGATCVEDFNECTSNPCKHGGQCIDQRNRFVCVCPVRYDGERCEHLWLQRDFFGKMEKRLGGEVTKMAGKLGSRIDSMSKKFVTSAKEMVHSEFVKQRHTLCSSVKNYHEMSIDGGRWSLVWKHSYLQVARTSLPKAKTFSAFCKPCVGLSDGWCNIPDKQLPGATEQMIVAYHKGTPVYAYKSPLNPQLGKSEQGARLMKGWSKVLDKCTRSNGIRPDINSGGASIIDGIAFDKVSPTNVNYNCDTVSANNDECRWHDCNLPKSISSKGRNTQMTIAIYVR